jgi:hypothetical protein
VIDPFDEQNEVLAPDDIANGVATWSPASPRGHRRTVDHALTSSEGNRLLLQPLVGADPTRIEQLSTSSSTRREHSAPPGLNLAPVGVAVGERRPHHTSILP